MEKVFLRVYNREIEGMIEGGQLDEAVAHCQHILKTYPMHLETYRLLGKAFLEARRYADAADIFERVLMAVPDDFVSHVGMSIIRDDQGRLDDAIWHMERAFEVQPSNSAIQGELRRLFGRRDGVEPSKIRLSRDALANMYSQGELFNQAIAEIRSVLAGDENRPDLQVMLTRAYYRSGQKVEAAEIAATLLKKYPYCMDALRVLVDVLPGTARADSTQVYRHRVELLDPYSSFAIDSVFASDKVADSAVSLERLDFRPGGMPGSSQPDWASSLGIKFNNEKKVEPTPDWMQMPKTVEEPTASSPVAPEPEPAPAKDATEDAIPEWMRSAGWLDSAGAVQESPVTPGEEPAQEPIAKADIPDWLMSMAPAEAAAEPEPRSEEPIEPLPENEQGIPDWLKPMAPEAPAGQDEAVTQQTAASQSVPSDDIPDFLRPMSSPEPPTEVPMEPQPAAESESAPDLSPWDYDESVESNIPVTDESAEPQKPVEAQPAEDDNIPNWLKGLAPVGLAAEETFAAQEPTAQAQTPDEPQAAQPIEDNDIPDWLKAIAPQEASEGTRFEDQLPVESQATPGEEIPDWGDSLASSETSAEPPNEPELPAEQKLQNMESEVPDWLSSLAPTEPAGAEHNEPQSPLEPQAESQESSVPDWLASLAPAESAGIENNEPQSPVNPQADSTESSVPDWPASLTPTQPAPEEHIEPIAPVEPQAPIEQQSGSSESNVPDWLSSLEAEEPELPQASSEPQASIEPQMGSTESNVPDWLSSLMAEEPATEESELPKTSNEPQAPIEPQAESMESNVPDWLASLASPEAAIEETKAAPAPVEPEAGRMDSGVPYWLSSLGSADASEEKPEEPQLPAEPKPDTVESSLPDWLASLGSTKASEEKPMEAQASQEPQPAEEENVPDWLKQIRQKREEPEQFAEPGSGFEQDTPGVSESMASAGTTLESNPMPESALPETPASDATFELPPATPPTEGAEAFPDFLTGMGARAAAAAAAASEAINQMKTDEQVTPQTPTSPEQAFQKPAAAPKPSMLTGDEAFKPSGEVKPLNIEDDAMAWLESLAAKQGAKPEELLTKPQDRSVEMPDWLRHPDEARVEPPAPLSPEVIRNLPETLPLEPLGHLYRPAPAVPSQPGNESVSAREVAEPAQEMPETVIPPAATPVPNDEDTLAWLEQLSEAEEPKAPEGPEVPEVSEAQEAPEVPDVPDLPDVAALPDTQPVAARRNEVGPPPPLSEPEEVVPTLPESEPEESAPLPPVSEPEEGDTTISSWLSKLDVEDTLGKKSAEETDKAQPAGPTEELPDWLKDLENPAAGESSQPNKDLPDWLRQPLPMDESQSGLEPTLPTWIDENVPADEQAIPTVPEEWLPAEAKTTEFPEPYTGPESIQEAEISPDNEPLTASENIAPAESMPQIEPAYFASKPAVIPPTLKQTGMLSLIPSQDKDAVLLSNAQTVLDQNSLNESMKLYSKLVRKGRLLDEVIHDLREAIYRYPVDVIIWQTLGDAYMRANRLQDALDAYTKAEELLR